jgi:hypothetical protein
MADQTICPPSCYHTQRNKAFQEARAACIAESLSDPQDDSDRAYDRAIRHCVAAIEALMKHQVPAPRDDYDAHTGKLHPQYDAPDGPFR